MESLSSEASDALETSLRMVDTADIYISIYHYRYSSIPYDKDKSITELEFDRAIERGIPILTYIMHPEHPLKFSDIEQEPGATRLSSFKAKVVKNHTAAFFRNPDEFAPLVVQSLSTLRRPELQSVPQVQ